MQKSLAERMKDCQKERAGERKSGIGRQQGKWELKEEKESTDSV